MFVHKIFLFVHPSVVRTPAYEARAQIRGPLCCSEARADRALPLGHPYVSPRCPSSVAYTADQCLGTV